jgi:Domain of unknown function (DUF4132)
MSQTVKETVTPEQHEKFEGYLDELVREVSRSEQRLYWYAEPHITKFAPYHALKNLRGEEKAAFMRYLLGLVVDRRVQRERDLYNFNAGTPGYLGYVYLYLFRNLMRSKIELSPEESVRYIEEFLELNQRNQWFFTLDKLPFGFAATQLERSLKKYELTAALRDKIRRIVALPAFETDHHYFGSDMKKVAAKLLSLADQGTDAAAKEAPPYKRLGGDPFGESVAAELAAMPENRQIHWHALFHEANAVSGGKPSKKYLSLANALIEQIGTAKYKSQLQSWLQLAVETPIATEEFTETYAGGTYTYETHHYLTDNNKNLLKGVVWTLVRFHDAASLRLIAKLAERSFEKIPGVGPTAAGLGNACIWVLAQSKGVDGVGHLSWLKLRVRQPSTQKLIQKHIEEQAARRGLKPAQIEDLAAPDFGLDLGTLTEPFDDYSLTLKLKGVGKVELQWRKPDGTSQKSAPAFVKTSKKHAERLKKLRVTAKEIQHSSTAQRDRIDRLYLEDMSWSYDDFCRYYLDHGVVSVIARRLIWRFEESDGTGTDAVYADGEWQTVRGEAIAPGSDTTVRMWHPIDAEPDVVLIWRDQLEALGITQPMKQAYREVYIVTDAELNTRTYSNRMAAHFLKQHQFNALAGLRGWKYALLGAFDDGRENMAAQKVLPVYGITAEYWIDEILDDSERFNDTGIWDYVATDQVRFLAAGDLPIDLVDVPRLVFSEIMRDVDLFVGVASVGNDPQWQDAGATRDQRDYWQAYSFGDLSEVARTRKAVLERLVPRLKIRDNIHIDGKFLIVDGKRHSYKIHIGSTNILILPNDRYLCIVPGRGKDKTVGSVNLPFEGDRGLSIILSKAFMLADDDQITDPTILSQL